MKPKCKCGKQCAYYGKIGGYSVACLACNDKNAARQRKQRAARRLQSSSINDNKIPIGE